MYNLYLAEVSFPVAPKKIETKIKNNNKVITLLNEGEVNILKSAGLTEISFELEIPHEAVCYAVYPEGFKCAFYYLEHLESLKINKKPFFFKLSRKGASGLYQTEYRVSLEDYKIVESVDYGNATQVAVKLKHYIDYQTTTMRIAKVNGVKVAVEKKMRIKDNAPNQKNYTVVAGDTLWNISKRFLGEGSQYREIAKLNHIANPNLIYPGQILKIKSEG